MGIKKTLSGFKWYLNVYTLNKVSLKISQESLLFSFQNRIYLIYCSIPMWTHGQCFFTIKLWCNLYFVLSHMNETARYLFPLFITTGMLSSPTIRHLFPLLIVRSTRIIFVLGYSVNCSVIKLYLTNIFMSILFIRSYTE